MSAVAKTSCPACGVSLNYDPATAGKVAACRRCGEKMRLPELKVFAPAPQVEQQATEEEPVRRLPVVALGVAALALTLAGAGAAALFPTVDRSSPVQPVAEKAPEPQPPKKVDPPKAVEKPKVEDEKAKRETARILEFRDVMDHYKTETIPKIEALAVEEYQKLASLLTDDQLAEFAKWHRSGQVFSSGNPAFYLRQKALLEMKLNWQSIADCYKASVNSADFRLVAENGYRRFPGLSPKGVTPALINFAYEFPQLAKEPIKYAIHDDVLYCSDDIADKFSNIISKMYGVPVKVRPYSERP